MNPEDRDRLVTEHISYVWWVATRLVGRSGSTITELDDLVSLGILGLIRAASTFDPTRGIRFITFAYPCIRGAIIDGLREITWAGRRGMKERRREAFAERYAEPLSLDVWHRDDDDHPRDLAGGVEPEKELAIGWEAEVLDQAIADLPEREQQVLHLHYYEGWTLGRIGELFGVTESRVCQLHTKALRRLRGLVAA